MRSLRSLPGLTAALAPLALAACSTLSGDPATRPLENPLGNGLRIAEVQDPASPHYKNGASFDISSAVVTWLDTFDETRDGKSVGTLYIQDVGANTPYSGLSVYETNYVPASLKVLPGDVLDFVGSYQESVSVGSAKFDVGTFLPQLSKPVGTFDYEFTAPAPATVTSGEFVGTDAGFAIGRKWLGMLVTIYDVTIGAGGEDTSGRVTYPFGGGDASINGNSVAISNELYPLGKSDFKAMTHFKSVTGLLTWFYSFHVAPRTPADLEQ